MGFTLTEMIVCNGCDKTKIADVKGSGWLEIRGDVFWHKVKGNVDTGHEGMSDVMIGFKTSAPPEYSGIGTDVDMAITDNRDSLFFCSPTCLVRSLKEKFKEIKKITSKLR